MPQINLDYDKYSKIPWVFGGNDFEKGMDCSGVAVFASCDLGHFIPPAPKCNIDSNDAMKHALQKLYEYFKENANWLPLGIEDVRKHGDIIVMNRVKSKSGKPRHVGIFLNMDGGVVMHSMKVFGVRFTPVHRLKDYDYKVIEIYRWQK